MKVLLVDDHRLVREGLRQILEDCKDHVVVVAEASDGVTALEKIRNDGIDAVVTDLKMPNMDGITLTRKIKEEWPQMPVLVITLTPEPWLAHQALKAGAREVVAKTGSSEDFCAAVMRLDQD